MKTLRPQYETVQIEAHSKNFGFGGNFLLSMIGSGRATQPRLVAVENSPVGVRQIHETHFLKQYSTPLEHLDGVDREAGMVALEELTNWLLMWGYDPEGRAAVWYARRFSRPYIPAMMINEVVCRQGNPDAVRSLTDAFLSEKPYCSHALSQRAYCEKMADDHEAARDFAMRALRVRPNNVDAMTVLAEEFMHRGYIAEAWDLAKKATQLAPGFEYPEQLLKEIQEEFGSRQYEHQYQNRDGHTGERFTLYCVKCRKGQQVDYPQVVTMRNGKNAVKAGCPVCGTGMYKILQ